MILEITKLLDEEFGIDGLPSNMPIFSANILDSMDVLRLMLILEDKYEIKISSFDVTIEMFDTIEGIASVVSSYK